MIFRVQEFEGWGEIWNWKKGKKQKAKGGEEEIALCLSMPFCLAIFVFVLFYILISAIILS